MRNMRIKKLLDYDITTLNYIKDTLGMLNEVYGATHISRDRDDILALHKEYPQKSPYGYGYSRAAAVYKHVRLSKFLSGVESGLGFRFPIEWDNNHVEAGVLNIGSFINEIRTTIKQITLTCSETPPSNYVIQQAIDKTFALEDEIQSTIAEYRRELEMFLPKYNEDIARAAEIIYKYLGIRENN